MKKLLFSPVLLVMLSLFISQFGSVTSAVADDSHVGDIRYSILSEEQFRRLHGEEWELLQGQPVPADSELRDYWGDRNLPDARGVFLRGQNHGRDPNHGNPHGNVGVGCYQGDEFKSHNHGGGNHRHKFWCEWNAIRVWGPGHTIDNTVAWYPPKNQPWHVDESGEIIHAQGGAETRPRNITVNTFIKVRENAREVNQPEINAEWVARLFGSADFLRSLTEAIRNAIRDLI